MPGRPSVNFRLAVRLRLGPSGYGSALRRDESPRRELTAEARAPTGYAKASLPFGSGIGRPSSLAVSIHSWITTWTLPAVFLGGIIASDNRGPGTVVGKTSSGKSRIVPRLEGAHR